MTRVPFNADTMELVDPPTADEQNAIRAAIRESGSYRLFWDRCDRVEWLLHLLEYRFRMAKLNETPFRRPLRRFACACARECEPRGPQLDSVLALAERACEEWVDPAVLEQARQDAVCAVAPTALTGLPRGSSLAAAMLAAWHAANPNALKAATWASRFARLTVAFDGARWDKKRSRQLCGEHYLDVLALSERRASARQAAVLKFLVSNPFEQPH